MLSGRLAMMMLRSHSFAYVVGIGIAVFTIALVLLVINRDDVQESQSAEPPEAPMAIEWEQVTYAAFKTGGQQINVLCQYGDSRIYVQGNRLRYVTPGESERTLYEWKYPGNRDVQAWLNGPYLLIGMQLENHPNGEWVILRMDSPEIIEHQYMNFLPEEVLTVTVAEGPGIFLLRIGNAEKRTEYLLDPGKSDTRWMEVDDAIIAPDQPEGEVLRESVGLRSFDMVRQCCLLDGGPVYMFQDEEGSIVYTGRKSAVRYFDMDAIDAKFIPFMDRSLNVEPRLMGRFRDKAGTETISFVGYGNRKFPSLLWEAGWELIDTPFPEDTFIRVTYDKLEAIQFIDRNAEVDEMPLVRSIPIQEGDQVTAKGELLQFERNGAVRTISWRDLMNAESNDSRTLLASPLSHYKIKEIPWQDDTGYEGESSARRVLEESLSSGDREGMEVPCELFDALYSSFDNNDYNYSVTYHCSDSPCYALVDSELMEYADGALTKIGELPITISVRVDDTISGSGALDFMRIAGGWIVADTQASRVMKLNDRLEIEAEIAIPTPYRISREGNRLRIDSMSRQWITDMDLKRIDIVPQPFKPIAGRVMDEESYGPLERYEDKENGWIWYFDDSTLFQVNEKKRQYRSIYVGALGHGKGQARFVLYKDEVLLLLDRKLERFDRQGNWIGTLEFPRAKPDRSYDWMPTSEGSLAVDEASGVLYLVQGYRVLRIDVEHNEVKSVFRQDYADIGKLIWHGGKLYFMLRSDEEDWYQRYRTILEEPWYTEIVEIDTTTLDVSRSFVDGFYDGLEVGDAGVVLQAYAY